MAVTEDDLERALLHLLSTMGYQTAEGPKIAPGEPYAEREDFHQVILAERLQRALSSLNPKFPNDALDEAKRKVLATTAPTVVQANRMAHRMLVDGVDVEYQRKDGTIAGDKARLIDFDDPEANDFIVVTQFSVIEDRHARRADIVIFINGLPLVVIELKNPADEKATVWTAFNQLQTYKQEIPSLFTFNEALIISDGTKARIGTITSDQERFMPWRTIEGDELAPSIEPEYDVLIKGVLEKRRLLELLRYCIVFEENERGAPIKKMAGYHQFHAVRKALDSTITASGPKGDKRVGVIWHTQGSGKSLTMVFYAGRAILDKRMENPTIVVITDRNDLDDQLFGTFSRCHELLRQRPQQAESREHLKRLLNVSSGGVIFTTIQKFFPEGEERKSSALSDRRNIVVIADEAHRSQYDFIDGFARHMHDALPDASFVGFTGTPLELEDRSTRSVFGEYISIYDIQRAVEDGATVPIYYESRLAKIVLKESEKPKIDKEFEEITEGQEEDRKAKLKTKWAAVEALVGSEKRLRLIANDLIKHYEQRQEGMEGKAMVVCMSRRICVQLYDELVKLRPSWHDPDDRKGKLKIVMTGSASDKVEWQQHIRNKRGREELANRFRDPEDEFCIVLVRDMWLTGFDVPCLHTMYLDKPMRGHTLMQAIARVNRVFRDKPGGLVVDYLGLADQLRRAMAIYSQAGGKGTTMIDQNEAVALMIEKYEVCDGMFHGFDRTMWASSKPAERIKLIPLAANHILGLDEGKERYLKAVTALSKAFALAVPHPDAIKIRDDVGFFQAVRAAISKGEDVDGPTGNGPVDLALQQLVSGALATGGVIDLFDALGLKKPDISILDDAFLKEVAKVPQKNLALELLRRLMKDEIRTIAKRNVVQSKQFSQMLQEAITKYENKALTTVQVIEALIKMAQEVKEARTRGEKLGLSDDELAFYDALETNDSAVKVLGDKVLTSIAKELTETINKNATIDWNLKESAQAKMRVMTKRILKKYGYPPDKQEKATLTVLEQAELYCGEVAA